MQTEEEFMLERLRGVKQIEDAIMMSLKPYGGNAATEDVVVALTGVLYNVVKLNPELNPLFVEHHLLQVRGLIVNGSPDVDMGRPN